MLKVANLSKEYRYKNMIKKAVDNVSFSVKEGEFIGIMGTSGSGKTTLLNAISTINPYYEGKVIIDGVDISTLNDNDISEFRKNKIGYIFQEYNLLDTLTIRENIALPLLIDGKSIKCFENEITKISRDLNIEGILDKYPYQTSGGQQQRTACARALITRPNIIFADEPTGALDTKMTTSLLKTLKFMNSNYNKTIVMVTHDSYAASFCDRILLMEDGHIDKKVVKHNDTQRDFFNRIISNSLQFDGYINQKDDLS